MADLNNAAEHLDEQTQRHYAAMVLGGWRFVPGALPPGAVPYWWRAHNPQGDCPYVGWTLAVTVERVWWMYGGSGK